MPLCLGYIPGTELLIHLPMALKANSKQNSDKNSYTQNRNSTRSNSPRSHKKIIVTKINPPAQKKDPHYSKGTKVSHSKFGDGIIMSVDQSGSDTSLTIAFKNEYGIKKLLSSMAKLKTL